MYPTIEVNAFGSLRTLDRKAWIAAGLAINSAACDAGITLYKDDPIDGIAESIQIAACFTASPEDAAYFWAQEAFDVEVSAWQEI